MVQHRSPLSNRLVTHSVMGYPIHKGVITIWLSNEHLYLIGFDHQTYGQAHWLSRSKSRLVTNRGYDCDMIGYILGKPAGSIHVDVYSPASL
jgi:hypothetical protein